MDREVFVTNVKLLCLKRGVKPTIACKEAGVGGSFLSDIKTRGSIPSVAKVQLLADYLGVTTSELLGEANPAGPGNKKIPTTVSGDGQAEKLAAALSTIGIDVDKLTDAEMARIARLAKAALEE